MSNFSQIPNEIKINIPPSENNKESEEKFSLSTTGIEVFPEKETEEKKAEKIEKIEVVGEKPISFPLKETPLPALKPEKTAEKEWPKTYPEAIREEVKSGLGSEQINPVSKAKAAEELMNKFEDPYNCVEELKNIKEEINPEFFSE